MIQFITLSVAYLHNVKVSAVAWLETRSRSLLEHTDKNHDRDRKLPDMYLSHIVKFTSICSKM